MIIPDNGSGCHAPRGPLPAELTSLTRWARWRSRTKKSKDKYRDAFRTAERVVYEAVHPATGQALSASRPAEWVDYALAMSPRLRKPSGGVGLLVLQQDGLAVLRRVGHGVLGRLGTHVVHAEQEVGGDGLAVIVRHGVVGAKSDVFVPLSGRAPYQEADTTCSPDGSGPLFGRNPEGGRPTGRSPYQDEGPDRTEAVPGEGGSSDGARTVFSSSLKN